jgi:ferrous iron transport protein A
MSDQQATTPLLSVGQPLAAFTAGQGAVITALVGGRKLQERLAALGLFPGQRLTVCQNNGSSLVVRLNGNRVALGRGISQKILATSSANGCRQGDACDCPIKGSKNES